MKNERNKLETIRSNYIELIELREYYHDNNDNEALKEINPQIKVYREIIKILDINIEE